MRIKGGVLLRLFGPTERYCLREMDEKKLITNRGVWRFVTGMQLISITARTSKYIRERRGPRVDDLLDKMGDEFGTIMKKGAGQ